MSDTFRPTPREIGALVLVALIWGSTWLGIKDQLRFAPAAWSLVWRFMLGAAGMFGMAWLRGDALRPNAPLLRIAAIVGSTMFFGSYQLVYASEEYLTSGLVAVIYALMLVPNAALARLLFGARVSGRFMAGSGVAIVGIGLLMANELHTAPGALSSRAMLGLALALVSLLSASIGNVAQASPAARGVPIATMLAWAMVIGALLDAVAACVTTGAPVWIAAPRYWLGVAYLGLVGSALTFPLYFSLIRQWGAGRAAYNGVMVPVVAMLLSTLFEHYRWSLLSVAGAALAMLGLLIALSGRSAASPSR